MIVGACTGIVGGFHRWLLVEDTHMKWLPDRVKCTGKNMVAPTLVRPALGHS